MFLMLTATALALITVFTLRPGCGGRSTCSAISGCNMSSRPWLY